MRKIMKRMAAIALLIALPALANAQTFEDDYFTYEKVTASSVKIVGFSTRFSEKADPIVLHEDGKIYLTRWAASRLSVSWPSRPTIPSTIHGQRAKNCARTLFRWKPAGAVLPRLKTKPS